MLARYPSRPDEGTAWEIPCSRDGEVASGAYIVSASSERPRIQEETEQTLRRGGCNRPSDLVRVGKIVADPSPSTFL